MTIHQRALLHLSRLCIAGMVSNALVALAKLFEAGPDYGLVTKFCALTTALLVGWAVFGVLARVPQVRERGRR